MATEIKIFFTYCGADQALKDKVFGAVLPLKEKYEAQGVELNLIAMDEKCVDRWDIWSKENAIGCDIMVPIITEHSFEVIDGREKVILTEIALGVEHSKRLVPLAFCPLRGKTAERLFHTSTVYASEENDNEAYRSVAKKVDLLIASEAEAKRERARLSVLTSAYDNDSFVGRGSDLAWLKSSLESSNVVVLTGEGGIGKTTLAETFFKLNACEYIGAYIVKAPDGIKSCITTLPFAGSTLPPEERYAKNKSVLEDLNPRTIIIFDNCDIEMTEREVLDELRNIRCKAIITSRDGLSDKGHIPVRKLDRMENGELLSLVRKHYPEIDAHNALGKEQTDALLCELFDYVDGHTLTVEMASAIMRDGEIPISTVKDKLLECKEKIITQRLGQRQSAFEHLGALYDFARLSKAEKQILNTLCLFSPHIGVERGTIRELLGLESSNEINALARKTLLRYNEATRMVAMHPLFADVYFQIESVHKKREYKLVASALARLERDGADMEKNERALQGCQFFVKKRSSMLKDKRVLGVLCNTIGRCLGEKGDFREQLEYHKRALEVFLAMRGGKKKHLSVATSYNNMGLAYNELGEYKRAFEAYSRALELRLRAYGKGKNHADIAWSYNNLGYTYGLLGDFENELKYAQIALDAFIKAHEGEPSHSDIASGYNNIGYAYENCGQYKEALVNYQKGLELRLEAYGFGSNHPHIAQSYNNIGTIYQKLGEASKGIECYNRALAMYLEVYKDIPNHPDIAWTYNEMGAAYYNHCEYQRSLECYTRSYEITQEVFDGMPNHPRFATCHNNLGMVYEALDDHEKALKHLKKALELTLEANKDNPNHPIVAMGYNNVGGAYSGLGDNENELKHHERALEYYERALEVYFKVYKGAPHPDIALAYCNIAYSYGELHDMDRELENYKKSLEVYLEAHKAMIYHPDVADAYSYVGGCYRERGAYEAAIEYMLKSVEIRERLHERDPGDIADNYRTLAELHALIGKYERAHEYEEKARRTEEQE